MRIQFRLLTVVFSHFPFLRDISVENLKFLSSEQALADLANFIESKNKEYGFTGDVKWIAFGGSYPGSLAAWLREKYPNLVYGAVSSSGPLLAKADFMGNFELQRHFVKHDLNAAFDY